MILAHQLGSRPDVSSNPDRPSRSVLYNIYIWSMSSLEKWNWTGCGKLDQAYKWYMIRSNSGCTLAITGCNQNTSGSDPACSLGTVGVKHFTEHAYTSSNPWWTNISLKPLTVLIDLQTHNEQMSIWNDLQCLQIFKPIMNKCQSENTYSAYRSSNP